MAKLKVLPKGLSADKLEELKKEHGALSLLPIHSKNDDKQYYCVVHKNIPKNVFRLAIPYMDNDDYKMMEILLNGCFVFGDEQVKEEFVMEAGTKLLEKANLIKVSLLDCSDKNIKLLPKDFDFPSLQKSQRVDLEIVECKVHSTGEKFYGLVTKELEQETIAKCVRFLSKNFLKVTDTLVYDSFIDGDDRIKSNAIYKFQIGMILASKLEKGEAELLDL